MIEDSQYFKVVASAYPNIGKKIQLFWGYPEFVTLVYDLQHDCSDRPRAGFPSEVLFALHELATDHDDIYPKLARKDANVWNL